LFFDGAMGTMLQGRAAAGVLPETLNITAPELVADIHRQYLAAGCDIVTANTFGANALALGGGAYSAETVIAAAIGNARAAGAESVALDIGPLGRLLKPAGTVGFSDAVALFARQVKAGDAAGADLILIETMSDLYEVKAAVIAAKENSRLPVCVSMTFDESLHTFMGVDALTAVTFLNAIGVDAMGINCSRSPYMLAPLVETFTKYGEAPVLVMPNAGLPVRVSGGDRYDVTPAQFADALKRYYQKGVSLFGGCCGTTPAHIAALTAALKGKPPRPRKPTALFAVTSGNRTVAPDGKIIVIGERLDPTGKPEPAAALRQKDIDFIVNEAMDMAAAGADILSVNACLPDIDGAAAPEETVEALQSVVHTPLRIVGADPDALERAVRVCNGKPLIHSVNGSPESLHSVLPIVKKYGAAVVGLTLDEKGIPLKAEGRLEIAKRIVDAARRYGIKKEDVLIDCLTLPAAARDAAARETLKAVRLVKQKLKVKTVLDIGNISLGLPDRPRLDSVFLVSALGAGLDAAIIDPLSPETAAAYRALNGDGKGAADYIASTKNTG
jgi:5-methyltetrahydrofolate--homocysteine methyltransferase